MRNCDLKVTCTRWSPDFLLFEAEFADIDDDRLSFLDVKALVLDGQEIIDSILHLEGDMKIHSIVAATVGFELDEECRRIIHIAGLAAEFLFALNHIEDGEWMLEG